MARYSVHGCTHITNDDGSIKSIHPMSFSWDVNSIKQASQMVDRTLVNVDRQYHSLVKLPNWIKKRKFTVYQAQETNCFWIAFG